MNEITTVKSLLSRDDVKQKFVEILRENAPATMANLAVMTNSSAALSKCDPMTIVSAAIIAASLNLPVDPNLGFAHIIPFGDKASFMIGYRGFIQLAMRSGQYKTINATEIYEGELIRQNRVTGSYQFNFSKKTSDRVIGYAAYFKLTNGFEKTIYWTKEQVEKHGQRFSQTYKKGYGIWKDDFDSMAKKSVIKHLISKWGILSIEMQNAVHYDQAVVKNYETGDVDYVDNDPLEKAFEDDKPVKAKTIIAEAL